MTRERIAGITLTVLVLVLALARPASSQQPAAAVRWAKITYLTTETAYIDAGRAEGVTPTTVIEVVRAATTIARLKVTFLATHQAACALGTGAPPLAVADSVRFVPASVPVDTTPRADVPPASPRLLLSRGGAIGGRVGLYYLTINQQNGSGGNFSQPSGDLRLLGSDIGGSGLGLDVDIRSRRLTQVRADGLGQTSWAQTRAYQAALSWQAPGSPYRFTAGRQFAPGIVPVGLVDGVSAGIDRAGWGSAVFVGKQPEPVNLGYSNQITSVGAYLERHSTATDLTRWSLLGGVSGSYLAAGTNREFLYLQGDYGTRRFQAYAAQEIDYYRPWRRVGGESALSPTSTFMTMRLQLTDGIALNTGIDSRRNVRLFQDVINPEVAFDNAFRRGGWVGLSARTGRLYLGLDGRTSGGGPTGRAASYTLSLGADRLTPWGLTLRTRSTRYTSVARSGWLQALSLGAQPLGLADVQISGGLRSERDSTLTTATSTTRWVSIDGDMNVGRRWSIVVSAYRERGGIAAHDLLYAGMTLRF